ncbi:hypothetical protein [Bradyrhizobium sp. SZCCHNR1070]|uniref:hypothetical protein n=1 Tax=Bradyrhizobium sp. SZCCHNR1070 TaxID=3057361 RepID=UPI0029165CFA|nr:hypothetical protein [Bradyrhizobium sp. SZCCHNR1070]
MQHSLPDRNLAPATASSIISELTIASGIAAVVVCLLSGYALSTDQVLLGDGLYIYEVFYNIFTQINQTGAIPRWFPYSAFGMSADLRHLVLPFLSIPVMEAANLLGVKNAWNTFLLVIAIDYWLTAVGIYLLSRQFATRAVAAIAAAALVWTIVIDNNIYFSLYTFITTPFTLLFLVVCARRQDLTYLVIAIVVAGLGTFLPTLYFAPYHALVYSAVGVTLAVAYRPRFSWPFPMRLWAWVAIAAVVLAAVGFLAFSSLQNIQFFAPDRDANLHSTLHDYLYYGGTFGLIKSLEPFIGVQLSGPNPLFFLTAIGVVFPLYAVWAGWSRDVAALLFLFWLFLFFCWGPNTPVATIAYYFPGMNFFRHVGYTFAFPKMFAVMLTAIGLQKFIEQLQGTERARKTALLQLGAISMLVAVMSVGIGIWYVKIYQPQVPHSYSEPELNGWIWLLLVTALAGAPLTWLICKWLPGRYVLSGLVVFVLVQATIYQIVQTYTVFHVELALPRSLRETTPKPFQQTRTTNIIAEPNGPVYDHIAQVITSYAEVFSFLQLDACFTKRSRTDFAMSGVVELLQRQFGKGKTLNDLEDAYRSAPDDAFFPVSGCNVAKLQWVAVPDERVASKLAPGQDWPDDCPRAKLCLKDPQGTRLAIPWPDGRPPIQPSLEAQGIKVEKFHFDDVSFSLAVDRPGWLIYADAFDPRWSVEVDGRPAESWQANLAYKAVHLDPGQHVVAWRFGRGAVRPAIFMGYQVLSTILMLVLVLMSAALGGTSYRSLAPLRPAG